MGEINAEIGQPMDVNIVIGVVFKHSNVVR